jgi:hypothetical protein
MSWGAQLVGFGQTTRVLEELRDQLAGDVVYLTGTNVEYGVWLEVGTSKMQAYPWLRPAVEEFKRSPRRFIRKHTETSLHELESTSAVVKTVALALERRMKDNVAADRGGSRSPGTHPEHPQVQSTNLRSSIRAVRIR